MLNGDGNENGKKPEKQIKQKQKQKCQVVHYTIFVHFFLHDNMKPPIYTFHEGNIVGVPVRFFFTAAQFHLGGSQHFSFSHLRYEIFMFFFNKIRLINEIICVERRTQKKILSSRWELRVFVQFFFFYMSLFISFFGYSRQYRHLKYLVEKSLLFVRVAIIFTPKTCMCLKCEISTGLHEGGGRTGGRFCQNQNILGAEITKFSCP